MKMVGDAVQVAVKDGAGEDIRREIAIGTLASAKGNRDVQARGHGPDYLILLVTKSGEAESHQRLEPYRRGQDALATAGKMSALQDPNQACCLA
jgi:hypothetical protein